MSRVETVLTTLMALAAISIAGLLVRREVFSAPAGLVQPVAVETNEWEQMLVLSRTVSGSGGPVKMVVFSDYECPACRVFHSRVRALEKDFPGVFEVRWAHMPLSYHKFAKSAAVVAECAARQGAFVAVTDALFESQDSLGLLPWRVIIDRIDPSMTADVIACAESSESPEAVRVSEGRSLADQIEATATPTVIIDGLKYPGPPTESELMRVAREHVK